MNKKDIPLLSATELSKLIQKKDVSPVEAVEAYLERIEEVDDKLNSYVTVCGDAALEDARLAEKDIARGDYRGPMHGIPYGVKDQFYTKGILTTGGSNLLADFVPDEDATIITNLKKAGAILLGKHNMAEFALGGNFHYPAGTPHNPWNLERNPGMSSGGSSAATAARLCATSVGEDTGGSIRNPCSYTGIVGMRPTWGRVSRYGVLRVVWSRDTAGPMTRTVEDCAITLGAIAGYDPKDQYTWNVPVPDYRKELDGDIRNIKVGVIRSLVEGEEMQPDIRDGVIKVISLLQELGASIEDVSLPLLPMTGGAAKVITDFEGAAVHYKGLKERLKEYDHNTRYRLLTGAVIPAQVYYKAQKIRAMIRQEMLDALETVDVLVLPTSPVPAPVIPTKPGLESAEEARAMVTGLTIIGSRSYTIPATFAGIPAISVPCGFTDTEPPMPFGFQVMGRPFEDGKVMKVAHAYQKNTDWHTRKPPI